MGFTPSQTAVPKVVSLSQQQYTLTLALDSLSVQDISAAIQYVLAQLAQTGGLPSSANVGIVGTTLTVTWTA